jgi:hypothetical protein
MASQKIRTSKVSFVKKHFDVLILPMALKKITTSKVYFLCYFRRSDRRSCDQLKSHFRRCDVVVVINLKDHFDVLKKMASRSSEIRRSDPLPYSCLFTYS